MLLTGLSQLTRGVVNDNFKKLRSSHIKLFDKDYFNTETNTYDLDKADAHIYAGTHTGLQGMQDYQNVVREYYELNGLEMPKEWEAFSLEKKIQEKREETVKSNVDAINEALQNLLNSREK